MNVAKANIKPLQQSKEHIKDWPDLWLSEYKRAGYVAITDFKKQLFFGFNDVANVKNRTEGKEKQFISLNAFDVDWDNKQFSRRTDQLKQIRNIGIDIDQYKLDLTIDEALDEIQAMILSNVIPEPNLVLTSRGIQLFYTINRGASPDMAWLASYITEQFISKLEHIGADSQVKDMSRVMRVPNSTNERNNAKVKPDIWNCEAYTLAELQAYCRPLDKFRSRGQIKNNIVIFTNDRDLMNYYKTNYARLRDLRRLIELRNSDLTGMRNMFLYIYSYHQSLVLNTQKEVLSSVRNTFKGIYSRTDKPISDIEFERTVKSAYKDAEQFFNSFKKNGYNVIYGHNDGIKKPMKTVMLIEKLKITEDEQYQLGSIRNKDVERRQRADKAREKRRSEGMKPMEEYNKSRKEQKQSKIDQLKQLMNNKPNATKADLARYLGIGRTYLYQLLKKIK